MNRYRVTAKVYTDNGFIEVSAEHKHPDLAKQELEKKWKPERMTEIAIVDLTPTRKVWNAT
jgi:hypothetical protein